MHLYGQLTIKITTIMTYKITFQMQGTVYAKMWISLVDITCKFVHLLQLYTNHLKTNICSLCAECRIFRRVRRIVKGDYWFRHVCLSARPSARNNSAPSGRISMKFYIWVFFENLSRKLKFH